MKALQVCFFIMPLLIASCTNKNPAVNDSFYSRSEIKENAVLLPAVQDKAKRNIEEADLKKIVKEGDITFETDNPENTRQLIISNLIKMGGYVSEETQRSSEFSKKTFVLQLRLPSQNFDKFLSSLSNKARHVESKNIRTIDVTTQYIDNKTRLENKIALEKRYIELLKKTDKINDILAIEAKLEQIRSDIESSQVQLNYLLKQVSFSSLTVTFFTKDNLDASEGFYYKLRKAIDKSFNVLSGIFFGVVMLWPIILIIVLLIWGLKYRRRRNK